MRSKRLQNRITTGRLTLPVVIFTCILCCGIVTLLLSPFPVKEITYPVWANISQSLPLWSKHIVGFTITAIVGYFLIEMNNRFNFIGIRASVQTSLYFLLCTAIPWIYPLSAGSIAALALLLSLFFLFKSYQEHESSGNLFQSFAFMGMGSLFFPQLTFLIPLWWLTSFRFQSLTTRSFCSTLVGWSFPYWLLFGYAFCTQQMGMFYQPFIELGTFHPVEFPHNLPLQEVVTLGYLFILFIVSSIHCIVTGYQDKIRTRMFLHFLVQLGLFFFLYYLLQPDQINNMLPSLLIIVGILGAHLFGLSSSRTSNVFFISSTILLILLFGFNIWALL